MSRNNISRAVRDICEEAMTAEYEETDKTPVFAKLASKLVSDHSWGHAPSMLRVKMAGWWETTTGKGKQRKAAKRQQPRTISEVTAVTNVDCPITTSALQVGAVAEEVDAERRTWAAEQLQQFNSSAPSPYIVLYKLNTPADIAGAQTRFRMECMSAWKKYKPVMPLRVEIPQETRTVWWRSHRLGDKWGRNGSSDLKWIASISGHILW